MKKHTTPEFDALSTDGERYDLRKMAEARAALAPTTPVPAEPVRADDIELLENAFDYVFHFASDPADGHIAQDVADRLQVLTNRLRPAASVAATPAQQTQSDAVAGAVSEECRLPPSGWRCTRTAGHDGPCAAVASTEFASVIDALETAHSMLGWYQETYPDTLSSEDEVVLVLIEAAIATLRATPPQQATPSAAASIKPEHEERGWQPK